MSARPALHVDLRMADDRQDLIVEGVDVAFRFGALQDSNATATMLGRCARIRVASPDCLAAHSFVMAPPGPECEDGPFRRAGAGSWRVEKDV
jgi:DNA-binding transcriptional LysR family regulator